MNICDGECRYIDTDLDIGRPASVGCKVVARKSDHLDVALGKLREDLNEVSQLRRAHGGEVVWMGAQET